MLRALAGRLLFALALVLVAFAGVYVLTALAPGDALGERATEISTMAVEAERVRLGLDRPVLTRLGARLTRLLVLDLGTSLRFGRPVLPLVTERTIPTLQAGGAALLLALALGIPGGVLASRTRFRAVRRVIAGLSIVLLSMPALVIALLLAAIGSAARLPSFVVMTIALGLPAAALFERLQARALDEAFADPCLRAVRARGVPAAAVTWRHAWPLSLPSVLGLVGVVAGHLLSGALAIELVTARAGLGRLTFEALMARDLDLAAACAGAAALIVGLATFTADALQLWMDPRLLDDTPGVRS
jgi:ABC-type dipeptide/oligopeptide/nickel transport system permease component